MSAQRSSCARLMLILVALLVPAPAWADEFWVAPTSQQDVGGLQVASNGLWPVTPLGAVRFAFAIPNNLQAFQSAKVVLIPHAPGGAANLNVLICPAQNGGAVVAACAGPFAQPFAGVANQLVEVDISAVVAPRIGTPGATYLAVVAFTTPTTTTDHVVGLRFAYSPTTPSNVATLGANTFTGIQTAPAFAGDGSALTSLPIPAGVATLGANVFSGTQTAPAFAGSGAALTNVPFPAGAATLNANTFTGTQTVNAGHVDLDASTSATGNLTKDGTRFLHNFGGINGTFLGMNAGNFTTTTFGDNTGIGANALTSLTTGQGNTAVGARAMLANTSGSQNAAVGRFALTANTTGGDNTAIGDGALNSNTGGSSNTGVGAIALGQNETGFNNTAVGAGALAQITTGHNNVAIGQIAGLGVITGWGNIYVGSAVTADAGESNTMRLGWSGLLTRAFMAGVRDVSVSNGEMVLIDPNGQLGSGPVLPAANSVGSGEVVDESLTASDLAPNAIGSSELAANSVTAAKVAFNYAGSGSEGGAASDLACAGCVAASEVSFSFATLGANTLTGTQTIDAGNLDLDASTATAGSITRNGNRFLHNFSLGTFLGISAGNYTMTGTGNTGIGAGTLLSNTSGDSNSALGTNALQGNTSGRHNTAIGSDALSSNTFGDYNTAIGTLALDRNQSGHENTAVGRSAMINNFFGSRNTATGMDALAINGEGNENTATGYRAQGVGNALGGNAANTADGAFALENNTGDDNTAVGHGALRANTIGDDNVALGRSAGANATTGSNNIYLGANVAGVAGESNTMYLGRNGTQQRTFIAGVHGTTTPAPAIPVLIDIFGQLGVAFSSRRYKEEVHDMAGTSSRLFDLRPVTFRYRESHVGGPRPVQFGLIAEEVAEVFPELVFRGRDGEPVSVHYETLNVLLLNEVQQQQRRLQAQQDELRAQREHVLMLEQRLNDLLNRFDSTAR